MDVIGLIDKKRLGETLDKNEIRDFFMGYMNGEVEDYQMSAMLMAIVINGFQFSETVALTDVFLSSGKKLDTSKVNGIMVDKHSTGGVGDKTSMIIGPIMASLGFKMGKLSGRGLGKTGGTIDKLDSIPGFRTEITMDEFTKYLNKVGFAEAEQTPEFTPLDEMIYDLRSVTGTVSSLPLIAASVMSKKLAVGAHYILIDIKVGEGALIKTREDAVTLANIMIEIGKGFNREVIPVLTNMNKPLGDNVGNALEVIEAMDVLKGKTGILRDLCIELASNLYSRCKKVTLESAIKQVERVLDNGSAYNKFMEFVKMQGGDIDKLELAPIVTPVISMESGTLEDISASVIGDIVLKLGGGRTKKNEPIDFGVGVVVNKHIGDTIKEGDILCYLYQNNDEDFVDEALSAFSIVK